MRFLPGGLLRIPVDRCAHWHQSEDGLGICSIYICGQPYQAQFAETSMTEDGLAAPTFTAIPLGAGAQISGSKCLPPPPTREFVTEGYVLKRSGLVFTEWRVRWVELNACTGLLKVRAVGVHSTY